MNSAALLLAALVAAQAPAAPPAASSQAAKPATMTVQVDASAKGGPAVEEWAKELRTALGARKEEFRLATAKEKADFLVRLDSIGPGTAGSQLIKGELVQGAAKRPFTYSFTNVRADAEKLARSLRPVAEQMKLTGK